MEEVKQLCHLLRAHFFGVIKFKLDIAWLVHFGRAWKRLNINGLHFIICQVILRGVWCRKWEGFAKFFFYGWAEQRNASSWLKMKPEGFYKVMRFSQRVCTSAGSGKYSKIVQKIFEEYSVREWTSAVSGEYSKNGAKLRKGRSSWKIDRFLNCQLSNLALGGKIVIQQNLHIKVFRTFHFYRIHPAVKAFKESTNALAL